MSSRKETVALLRAAADTLERLSASLSMGPGKVHDKATAFLQSAGKKLKKTRGVDVESALLRAGFYAQSLKKSMYVYQGNSYMHVAWQATDKKSNALNPINNMGAIIFVVAPDLTVTEHETQGRATYDLDGIIDYDAPSENDT